MGEVRQRVWQEAKKYPTLIDQLKSADNYVFVSVTQEAKTIEYFDYNKRICDLKLFYTFFKLVEAHGNIEEKTINSNLSKIYFLIVI